MSEPAFVRPQEPGNPLPPGQVGVKTGGRNGVRTHGTVSTYSWGCRCVDCRAAKRLFARNNKGQLVAKRQRELAARYVRENLPHTWARLRIEAEEEVDARASVRKADA